MAGNTGAIVELEVDLSKIEKTIFDVTTGLKEIRIAIHAMTEKVAKGVSTNQGGLQKIDSNIGKIEEIMKVTTASLSIAITTGIAGIVIEMKNAISALESVREAVERNVVEKTAEFASNATGVFANIKSLVDGNGKNIGNTPKGNNPSAYTNDRGQLLLPAAGESSYGKNSKHGSSASGIVSGGLMELGSGFPDAAEMEGLAESIGNVAGKLKETAIQWGLELKAKALSRAEDLKIIAINTVEHVKAFGMMISQLALSAGAWIAETAAKVANTAAQWAQIAATTAWQAICVAATAVTTAFGAAMTFLTGPIGLVILGIAALIAIVVLLVKNWDTVSAKAQEVWSFIEGLFAEFDAFLQGVFAKDFTEQFGAFGNVLNAFFANVENIWNAIKSIFSGIVDFVKNVFAGDWGAAWDSIVHVFKGIWEYLLAIVKAPINGIIGLINGLVQGVVDGINLVIKALNSVSFGIPDWVPVIGGQTFGFNLQMLNAPQIPYLAKGAVLPANKPFLAVVGDQKHGTNVEAPLTTIQEAVGLVMGDHIAAMMAGFEALLKEQQATRRTIEGIEIGDAVIGRAAERYGRKMAVVRGGV